MGVIDLERGGGVNLSVMGGESRYRIDSGRVGGRNRIAVISGWWVLSCMVRGRLWGGFLLFSKGLEHLTEENLGRGWFGTLP